MKPDWIHRFIAAAVVSVAAIVAFVWESITKQFTRYGQIYREVDFNLSWMHHGEFCVLLYSRGKMQSNDEKRVARFMRFAAIARRLC